MTPESFIHELEKIAEALTWTVEDSSVSTQIDKVKLTISPDIKGFSFNYGGTSFTWPHNNISASLYIKALLSAKELHLSLPNTPNTFEFEDTVFTFEAGKILNRITNGNLASQVHLTRIYFMSEIDESDNPKTYEDDPFADTGASVAQRKRFLRMIFEETKPNKWKLKEKYHTNQTHHHQTYLDC